MSSPQQTTRRRGDSESESPSSSDEERYRRRRKKSKRRKRRRHKEEDSHSSKEDDEASRRKRKKERKRHKRRKKEKKKSGRHHQERDFSPEPDVAVAAAIPTTTIPDNLPAVAPNDQDVQRRQKTMAPMSKEQYDKQQSQVRQVFDPESGRVRLVRGSGEIVESIVSRSQHEQINRTATQGDGSFYARSIFQAGSKRR